MVNCFGILGIICTVIIYQQKENQRLLIWKLISDLFWTVHYAALRNYSVVAITLVAIMRSVVLYNHDKKWAHSGAWLWIFIGCSLAFSAVAWKDWTSLMTTVSSLLCIIAYWVRIPRVTRLLTIPAGFLFLVNIIFNYTFWGLLSESFLLTSAIVGFIRLDLKYYLNRMGRGKQPLQEKRGG